MSTLPSRLRSLLIVAIVLFAAARAHAASDIYIQAAEAPGDSTDAKHPGWIDVQSYNDTVSGGSRGFTFSTSIGRSLPRFVAAATTGQIFKLLTLEMRKAGTTQLVFLNVKFENVRIVNVTTGAALGAAVPVVNVSFACDRATWTYTPSRPDGTGDTPIVITADFRAAAPPSIVLPEIPRYKP